MDFQHLYIVNKFKKYNQNFRNLYRNWMNCTFEMAVLKLDDKY